MRTTVVLGLDLGGKTITTEMCEKIDGWKASAASGEVRRAFGGAAVGVPTRARPRRRPVRRTPDGRTGTGHRRV